MKKFFSVILALFILHLSVIPVFANKTNEVIINTKLVTDINVNKSSKGQVVQFVSNEDYRNAKEVIIPKGTIFNGKITSKKKSRFAYRRAKAKIDINEMVFPNGERYKLKGQTKRHVYKGSAIGNVAKGIVTAPIVLVVFVAGGAVMVVEAVTIVGILAIPPTALLVSGTTGKLSNGVNCKIERGTQIPLKIRYTGKIINQSPSVNVNSEQQNSVIQNNVMENNPEVIESIQKEEPEIEVETED